MEWIRGRLPLYEIVWSEFIGHDGNGRPLEIPGLSADLAKRRRTFYQAHYSMALYCHFLDVQCDGILAADNSPREIDGYLADFESFVNFITFLGQVYDMVEDMATALHRPPGVIEAVRPFYGVRSHSIHAARIPLQHDGLSLKIPPISGLNKADGEWHDQTTWDEVDPTRFVYLIRHEFERIVELRSGSETNSKVLKDVYPSVGDVLEEHAEVQG